MRRFLASIPIWIACFTAGALAQGRIDCSSLDSRILKRPVRYCVQVPPSYDKTDATSQPSRYPVLYFLHGLNDDEQSFFKTGGWTLIEDLRQRGSIGDFLIVAPEGRNSFYINSADGKVRYSDFFLREFIPYIEKKYRVVPDRAGRAVSGISMGGYGALRLGFANPQLFGAVQRSECGPAHGIARGRGRCGEVSVAGRAGSGPGVWRSGRCSPLARERSVRACEAQ